MAAPTQIIFDMIVLILDNTIGTLLSIFTMFGELLATMIGVSQAGGIFGLILFFAILVLVGYFIFKFLVGSLKIIGLLILATIALLAFVAIGLGII